MDTEDMVDTLIWDLETPLDSELETLDTEDHLLPVSVLPVLKTVDTPPDPVQVMVLPTLGASSIAAHKDKVKSGQTSENK